MARQVYEETLQKHQKLLMLFTTGRNKGAVCVCVCELHNGVMVYFFCVFFDNLYPDQYLALSVLIFVGFFLDI